MDKRYILFDLDGTLTDSYEGIINGFKYALDRLGVEPQPETFRKCVGPPIIQSLKSFYGFDDETADEGLRLFREYYSSKGIHENAVYEGVETMLRTLNAHGKKLMIATAKPENMAEQVLENFDLAEQFCFIAGSTSDRPVPPNDPKLRASKEDVINYILRTNDILDPENAVMVGDRSSDITAAKRFGLQTIGVSYGYGSLEELKNAGADHIVDDPMQLVEIIVQS